MQWLPVFKIVNPLSLNLEISIEFRNSVLKIDINIVTNGPGDIIAKEKKIILIFKAELINKSNTTYRYLLALLNASFWN